jgi:pimeloyl-ACP methyl ester carboxylesterase
MSVFRFALAAVAMMASLVSPPVGEASAQALAPYKNQLFAYPAVLAEADGGRHLSVDYQEMRDINGRDEIPERRVKAQYVDLSVRRQQKDLVAETDVARIPHMIAGKGEGARFIVVYLYGQGGSRRQGMDDFTFGGNFNRIKNLAVRNGGLYITTDFSDFGDSGARQVASLLAHYVARSPAAPVIVACGSMGGALCWRLADDPGLVPRLGGLMLLGSHWEEGFLTSAGFRRRVPVFFGHGGNDSVFPVAQQEAFFRKLLQRSPDYPTRFVRFESGSHGTPIRMTDWRETINWMLSPR